ncbi:MAG TPA: alpha-amylase family glycosyl hydrolase [Polyangiaceae bacterium]|nr:alpha-amylase family glycosyl hydrolase [Polyangiaceae bacterium]
MKFTYDTGIRRKLFSNARLCGSWDASGRYSERWSERPMREVIAPDGAVVFEADVELQPSEVGKEFLWAVLHDGPLGLDREGIVTEQHGLGHDALHRKFVLTDDPRQEERYYLTHVRRLGARKVRVPGSDEPGLRFAVWAPNAQGVEVVFGDPKHGYVADDGTGIDPGRPVFVLEKREEGVWSTGPEQAAALRRFRDFAGAPYMYRIKNEDGRVVYRTDLHSRAQVGTGDKNPEGKPYEGTPAELNGVVACSVVVDTELVQADPSPGADPNALVSEDEFWRDEFNHLTPFPHRIDDFVIYELHVGSLGFGSDRPGNFHDAIALVDYLTELGVNAVELLPIAEANGTRTWGYGNSHHFAIESSAGGRDLFRHFVRACHQRGIAVIVDVVYNHYVPNGERAQWHYDSDREENNVYYWYEGKPSDYPAPDGGYLDNLSTGFAPRFHEEMVRKLFISSAAALVMDFHVDGFRVDQTTSIHAYNVVHADGRPAGGANLAGAKFLRELSRTLRLLRPATLLTCEDHSDWVLVTEHPDGAGLGFDATWYSNFYHNLIGDTGRGPECANLLKTAGMGGNGELALSRFAEILETTKRKTVVYHESHDEAGNSEHSARTLMVAINADGSAPAPTGDLRRIAEARVRFVAGMTLLSAGTPMFLMGEEIGATKDFTYDGFLENREDLLGERQGNGRFLFRFYRDLIRLRRRHHTFATANIEIMLVHDADRVLAFHRWNGPEHYIVVSTLRDDAWTEGYDVPVPNDAQGNWRELFTSDADIYGGSGVTNEETLDVVEGKLKVKVPARGFVVLRHVPQT